jgi:hypothetical protein
MGIAIDIHRVGKTMLAWSPSPIRNLGPSGPPPTAYRLRSAAPAALVGRRVASLLVGAI